MGTNMKRVILAVAAVSALFGSSAVMARGDIGILPGTPGISIGVAEMGIPGIGIPGIALPSIIYAETDRYYRQQRYLPSSQIIIVPDHRHYDRGAARGYGPHYRHDRYAQHAAHGHNLRKFRRHSYRP